MRIVLRMEAGEHEIFAQNAFDGNVGKTIPVDETTGVVISAEVIEDGKAVNLTIEVNDGEASRLHQGLGLLDQRTGLRGLSIEQPQFRV